ncbi:MAG TPA: NAD(P)-dependent oxidoreductase [Alphaproteobacteria bacterium]|nr:NAD(P)-dependent oxidoreductase [Alphaproteobacteria bacterium]
MRVGFIGVGNIGKPMAEQFLQPGYELTVFDVSASATEPFAGKAKIAASPAELGRDVEQVGICVRHDADVTAVVTGPDGLLQTMQPDTIIAVHSTVRPATVKTLAETAKAKGVHLLDAGVSGGPMGAAAKKLVTMIGGEAAEVERVKKMVEAFSGTIIHAGGTGMGMALKLCNNLVTYMQLQAAMESVRLAIAGGLDEKLLREVMANNGNLTTAMGQYLDFCATGPARMGQEAYMAFKDATAGLAEKDLDFALGFAKDVGVELKGTETIRQITRESLRER